MKDQIETLIQEHCELLRSVNTDTTIAQVVKSIDTVTQQTYQKIYALRDGRKNGSYERLAKQAGHCC